MHVLITESDENLSKLLVDHFSGAGCQTTLTVGIAQAMQVLSTTEIDMQVVDGALLANAAEEFVQRIRALKAERFFYLVAIDSAARGKLANHYGANIIDDFITDPSNRYELDARVACGARLLSLEGELHQKEAVLQRTYHQTVELLSHFIDLYDSDLGSHCHRVGELALRLAQLKPDIPAEDLPLIETAGLLHDIGLIGLPKTLLSKRRTEFTGEEAAIFRSHPQRGEQLLERIEILAPVAPIVRSHHEQFNGRGFPDGNSGALLNTAAVIVSAANIYDNLVNRHNVKLINIPEHLQQFRGYQLSPESVELLLEYNMTCLAEESKRAYRNVALDHLVEGMVLGRDILMKTGAFVMAGGTRLDWHTISKLKHYRSLGNIPGSVFIKK